MNEQDREPRPPRELADAWGLRVGAFLGGRLNRHWEAVKGTSQLVLRGSTEASFGAIEYELDVLRRLHALGWPVPLPVEGATVWDGRTWCLFTRLPGAPTAASQDECRARGRLLAQLHQSSAQLSGIGQRAGFALSDEVLGDPELSPLLDSYAKYFPDVADVLRWHLERAYAAFTSADLVALPKVVLHSDFTQWNLLFEDGRVTGVLDFEATHLNYRIADFALSWRGEEDAVIDGYEEVSRLTETERNLLVPAYWSWLFIGVRGQLERFVSGEAPPHRFEWVTRHLLRRSGSFSRRAPEYPGR